MKLFPMKSLIQVVNVVVWNMLNLFRMLPVCVCVWVSLREQSHTPFHQLDRPDLQVYGQLKPRNFKRFVMCSLHMQFTSNNKIINNNPNINRNSEILIISIIMIILATTITIIIAELVPQ